ncbi:MAG: DUF177 domain-containing protein [Crocinitomicaceae bacterium]
MRKRELLIRFSGLSEGFHKFHFEIDKTFFEQFDYSELKNTELKVDVVFEKKPDMNILNIEIVGKAEVMCDKCTDDFFVEIQSREELIYKFGDVISDDEKIIFLPENEIELDISQPVYEMAVLAVPPRRIHPEGTCNQEMLKTMDNYLMVAENESDSLTDESLGEEEEADPRWEALKKLKNKKLK